MPAFDTSLELMPEQSPTLGSDQNARRRHPIALRKVGGAPPKERGGSAHSPLHTSTSSAGEPHASEAAPVPTPEVARGASVMSRRRPELSLLDLSLDNGSPFPESPRKAQSYPPLAVEPEETGVAHAVMDDSAHSASSAVSSVFMGEGSLSLSFHELSRELTHVSRHEASSPVRDRVGVRHPTTTQSSAVLAAGWTAHHSQDIAEIKDTVS